MLLKKIKLGTRLTMLCFIIPSLQCETLWAWGAKGHSVICEAAVHLVKNSDLKAYLLHKTHTMSHLCNIPDIYWRQLPGTESGNSTHFIEPDLVGASFEESPIVLADFINLYQGKSIVNKNTKVFSVEKELGTIWWRADQFIRLAIASGKNAKSLIPPEPKNEKTDDYPYNKALFDMFTNMGLLGHFVGDAAQPLHNTANYDGWQNNHGGIHGYYEEMIVVQLGPKLLDQVINAAPKVKDDLGPFSKLNSVEHMKKLSIISYRELPLIWKLDPIETISTESGEKGMAIRKNAKRTEAIKIAKKFEPLIVKQMSRAAVLLAYFWDEIYTQSQTPNLEIYKGYRFPLQPDFVAPDYFKNKAN